MINQSNKDMKKGYTVYSQPNEKTVTLQSVGHVLGEAAMNVKVGDVLMWNFGGTSEVLDVKEVSKQFIEVTEKSKSGYVGNRRMKKTRLVVILK